MDRFVCIRSIYVPAGKVSAIYGRDDLSDALLVLLWKGE